MTINLRPVYVSLSSTPSWRASAGLSERNCPVVMMAPRSDSKPAVMSSSAPRRSACSRVAREKSARASVDPREPGPFQRRPGEVDVAQQAVLERDVGELSAAEVHRVQLAFVKDDPPQGHVERLDPGGRTADERRVQPGAPGQVYRQQPDVTEPHVAEPAPAGRHVLQRDLGERALDEAAAVHPGPGIGGPPGEVAAVVVAPGRQVPLVRSEGPGERQVAQFAPQFHRA